VWLKLLEHPVGIAILSVLDVNGGRALVSGIRGERCTGLSADGTRLPVSKYSLKRDSVRLTQKKSQSTSPSEIYLLSR
jgi:hypothetical protein